MVEFQKINGSLVLKYESMPDQSWIYKKLDDGESVSIKRTFHVGSADLYGSSLSSSPEHEEPVEFLIATQKGEYFHFNKNILSIEFDLYIHKDVELTYRSFTAEKNVSIFSKINDLKPGDVHIGGPFPGALPEADFKRLIKQFPNTYELRKYVLARVSSVVRDFFDTKIDGEQKYHQYLNKKLSPKADELIELFKESEIQKFSILLEKLKNMLVNEISYSEAQWQSEILQIILLLFPKYIRVFKETPVKDTYNNKTRKLDFMLVDSSGNTDIIEIKQPFDKCIVTSNQYRDNYIPLRELSGTVMQIEKYIFYLTKWGRSGEEFLTKKYKSDLPNGFNIKITNPAGLIVMGRDGNLSVEQKQDLEVIKRKYKHVIDIITYDDLLRRLRFTIEQLKKHT